jgi:SAM-dependent methyltransferase
VRTLAFPDETFDVIYSMGTIEHFADYDVAVREMFRVLKPGGRAIIGVPNKLDPFLRPALVWGLHCFGLYAYGVEKSFTMKSLRHLLESEGFRIRGESGVLFMPGWLRMLDLLCHTRFRPGERFTAPLIRPFAWLHRRVPRLRRHGYLIACLGVKEPSGLSAPPPVSRPSR